jgi:hypothetical protein
LGIWGGIYEKENIFKKHIGLSVRIGHRIW